MLRRLFCTFRSVLRTQLLIVALENMTASQSAAGMLLQIMPDGSGTSEDFEHLTTLAATVKDEELFGLPAEELLSSFISRRNR